MTEQQTGIPFIIMQQQQPGMAMQAIMHAQQAWIILAHISSPLVQVMVQPISVISTRHMPMVPMLWQQQVMPLHMQAMEHMALGIIMHRFFIISAAVLSSHVIVHCMPSAIVCIFIEHRGTIVPAMPMPPPAIMPGIIIPGIAMLGMPPIMGMLIMLGIPPVEVPMPLIIRSEVMPVFIVVLLVRPRFAVADRRLLPRADIGRLGVGTLDRGRPGHNPISPIVQPIGREARLTTVFTFS